MDVLEAIRNRRSVRAYSPRPIDEAALGRMRQALRFAPSACNHQPWRFLFVYDEALRRQVASATRDMSWLAGGRCWWWPAGCRGRRTRRWAAPATAWRWTSPSPWTT